MTGTSGDQAYGHLGTTAPPYRGASGPSLNPNPPKEQPR
jgi:hypothetical protein